MVGDNAGFNDLVTLFYSGLILEWELAPSSFIDVTYGFIGYSRARFSHV